jgi:hypothetical protein
MGDEPKKKWWSRRRAKLAAGGPPHADLPPISREDLKALFDHLDRPNPDPCTSTFKETISILRDRNLPVEEALRWLHRNGAGCDCEVIFNTEAEWGLWSGRSPDQDED